MTGLIWLDCSFKILISSSLSLRSDSNSSSRLSGAGVGTKQNSKHFLAWVKDLLEYKKFVDNVHNVEGDAIESMLPFKIFCILSWNQDQEFDFYHPEISPREIPLEKSSNVLPLHLKQIFPEGEGDGI